MRKWITRTALITIIGCIGLLALSLLPSEGGVNDSEAEQRENEIGLIIVFILELLLVLIFVAYELDEIASRHRI